MAGQKYSFVFDIEDESDDKVFYDPTRRRAKRVRHYASAAIISLLAWAIFFFGTIFPVTGTVEEIKFRWQVGSTRVSEAAAHDHAHPHDPASIRPTLAEHYREAHPCTPRQAPAMAAMADNTPARRIFGHIPTALENASLSLEASCGALDVLMPDWFALEMGASGLELDVQSEDVREAVEAHLSGTRGQTWLMPTVRLSTPLTPDPALAALLDPAEANRALTTLLATARSLDATGLCLDFDQLDPAQLDRLKPFFARVQRTFRQSEMVSCITLAADQPAWEDPEITRHFDQVVLKAFHQPWLGSVPAPLAGDTWFRDVIARAVETLDSEKLVVALGTFAADWTLGQPLPETISFAEATRRVRENETEIRFSDAAGNGFAGFRDAGGRGHKLWMLDAVSAYNQLHMLDELGVANVAIWSLGQEDPGLWPVLVTEMHDMPAIAAALGEIRLANNVQYGGAGPFLRVTAKPVSGMRFVRFSEETGRIAAAEYRRLPRPFILERYGQAPAQKLVLTFDDGPHPEYTSDILDTLKATNVPASFFVVGARVMQEPALLARMIEEGHEVGSHSFSHARMDRISQARADLELSMMQKLIAGYTGRETMLYREPFQRAGGPIEEQRVASLALAQSTGAIIAGMEVVPKDWEGLSAQEIVDYVVTELETNGGNVLLLHDGGDNREATVAAVPMLIEELRARGYAFTTLGDLLGIAPEVLMPATQSAWPMFDRVSFEMISFSWSWLETVFWVVIAIGLARAAMIAVLVMLNRKHRPIYDHSNPKVAVVIPAHNEEKGIGNCIRRVLDSDYENFEVIAVDDGSTDDTFAEMEKFDRHPKVRGLAQINRGKWGALNTAIRNTDAEILVCIDADTQIRPDALSHMVKHFTNPKVGAVAGKVVVGNRVNLVTRLQALEYAISQNFERRAYDKINGMLVVPGAIGAWRVAALREVGMYSHDTLAEDADVSMAVNRAGYRSVYEDRAVAHTEAPETVRQLMRQRLRWSLGMLQCAWKHKGAARQGRTLGLVSIPDLLIFGYLFALLAPVADLFLIMLAWSSFMGDGPGYAAAMSTSSFATMLFAYLSLPALEVLIAGFALKTDRDEKLWPLLLFPFQRFFYRQILYFTTIRAILRALTGGFAAWGQLRRKRRDLMRTQATI